jgi:hypothetical protein
MKKYIYLVLFLGVTVLVSCKKTYLDTSPTDSTTDENLYSNAIGCYQVLDGMARLMTTTGASLSNTGSSTRHNDFGQKAIDLAEDCMSHDVVCAANDYDWFADYYNFSGIARANYAVTVFPWGLYYKIVNASNLLIANVDKADATESQKANIKGQAYAYRAWAYYKLSIYYCKTYSLGRTNPGVPIYTVPTTAETIGGKGRSSVGEVYDQIISDLQNSTSLLESSSVNKANKSYISLATNYGIYAEVALVMNEWDLAEEMAEKAIQAVGGASKLMDAAAYMDGFNSATNSEWMWASQLTPAQTQSFGILCFLSFVDASNANSYAGGGGTWRKIPKYLYDVIPGGDVRKATFAASDRKQTKFHIANPAGWTYDNLYMRLAEMYLIKAEAQAQNGGDAVGTLETLVKKRNPAYTYAGTPYYTGGGTAKQKLLEEVYLQRRIELWLEGKAYSDMLRLQKPLDRPSTAGNFSASTAIVMQLPANSNKFMFKIPQSELDANRNMSASDQNPD